MKAADLHRRFYEITLRLLLLTLPLGSALHTSENTKDRND